MADETTALTETVPEAANTNESVDKNPVQCNTNVPTDSANNAFQTNKCSSIQPCSSRALDENNDAPETDQSSSDENPCTSMENKAEGHMMKNLQDRLTKIRDGFLEKYDRNDSVQLVMPGKGISLSILV